MSDLQRAERMVRCVLSRQSWTVMGEQTACVSASYPVSNSSSSSKSDGSVRAPSLHKGAGWLQIGYIKIGGNKRARATTVSHGKRASKQIHRE